MDKNDVETSVKSIISEEVEFTVVINDGLLEASSPHSQLVNRNGKWKFIPLHDVEVGDLLIDRNDDIIEVYSVDIKEETSTVYKMTLNSPYHTFYANSILTHNIKGPGGPGGSL